MMRPVVWAFSIYGFLAAAEECQGPGDKCESMRQEVETAGFVMLAHRKEISRITEAEEETSTKAKNYPESPSTYCGSGSNGCGSEGNCEGANQLHLRGKTVEECQAECDKRELCGGFRYQKSVGHCHFYKNCAETKTGNADLSYYEAVEAKSYPESPSTYCGSGSNGCGSEGNCAGANQLHLKGKTLEECQAQCDKRQLCGGFRYQKSAGHCHFYKNCAETKTGNADLSYYEAVEAKFYAESPSTYCGSGSDGCGSEGNCAGANQLHLRGKTAEECQAQCDKRQLCGGFRYQRSVGHCHFYKKCAEAKTGNADLSYYKVQAADETPTPRPVLKCPQSHPFKYPGTQRCFVKKWEDGCSLDDQWADPGHPLCTEALLCPDSHPFKYPGTQRCFVRKWTTGCSLNDHFADASHPLCTEA